LFYCTSRKKKGKVCFDVCDKQETEWIRTQTEVGNFVGL
jgi:hypothetical protein